MRRYPNRITAFAAAITTSLAAFAVPAQEQEPVYAEAPAIQAPMLFVEMPQPFQPELDPVLAEITIPLNPEDDPEFIARIDSIRQYNSVVEEIELGGGAWDELLTEELVALGTLQQQQNDHAEAITTFNRAIHITRINSGLHTLEQIPAVEKLIESYLAMGDWAQADLYYEYLFYIQQKAYGPHDPRMIPVLDRLGNWNIQAFNIGFGESLGVRLSSAQILFNAAARMVAVHFGENDARYIDYRRHIANSAYLVARNPGLLAETESIEYRNTQQILMNKIDGRSSVRPRGFQAGELALREIVQHYSRQGDKPYELAAAVADLGDWYLIFGQRRAAEDLYMQAWDLLQASDHAEEWEQRLFGAVVPIPTFANSVDNLLRQPLTTVEGKTLNYEYVEVMMDVTETGEARNVEVLSEETQANSGQFSRLRREIRNSYFRPRIEAGEIVRSDQNYFRYRYWY